VEMDTSARLMWVDARRWSVGSTLYSVLCIEIYYQSETETDSLIVAEIFK